MAGARRDSGRQSTTGGSVPVHTIAILSNHRGTPQIGPGELETYSEFAVTGIAALTKLPL